MNDQKIQITAEPQSRPDQCLFRFDRTLYSGTFYTSDSEWSQEWAPFAAAVFATEGIKGLRIRNSELLVTLCEKPDDWRDMARAVGSSARDFLDEGGEIIKNGAFEAQMGDDLIRQKAQDVVDTKLNPGLAGHGGFVEIVDSDGKDLYLNMGGGCQGCSSASATMNQGVEVAIRDSVPEVGRIIDATNHAIGANPYM
ncbi:MAG TPA: NifU family protein [Planctomycetota bacterium]|jgi:Fe/S biogenesis protein NfuA|nr:NifU family protein [Planctomycetota bacterium]